MTKSEDAYRTISEVAKWLGTQAHVLRYWESKFQVITPIKSKGGRRYYDADAMSVIGGIKHLLHIEGMTIKAVAQMIDEKGVDHISSLSPALPFEAAPQKRDLSHQTRVDTNVIAFKFDPLPKRKAKPKKAEQVDASPQPFLFPELALAEEDPLALTADFIDRTPGDGGDEPMLNLFVKDGESAAGDPDAEKTPAAPIRMAAKAPQLDDFAKDRSLGLQLWRHMDRVADQIKSQSGAIAQALNACKVYST